MRNLELYERGAFADQAPRQGPDPNDPALQATAGRAYGRGHFGDRATSLARAAGLACPRVLNAIDPAS